MRRSSHLAPAAMPYLFLLPAFLLLTLVLYVPIGQTILNAFYELDRYGNKTGWAGLANFRSTFEDTDFRFAFKNTVVWTAAVVILTLFISFVAALFLHRQFAGRRIARAILVLPWASSLVISALVWRYILDGELGPFNALLGKLHLISEPVYWLATRTTSFPAMIGVAVFVSIPFTTTVLLAGLQAIPNELLEAARVDGASPMRVLRSVTLPHLSDVLAIATIINVIHVFNSFPIVWTMTHGDPAGTTDIVMTHLYKKAFTDQQFAVASAESVIVFAALLAFSIIYTMRMRKQD
ncbi:MAG: carbohydrate ABC transporter permease [Candidatus Sumerlaeaceae bacterium]